MCSQHHQYRHHCRSQAYDMPPKVRFFRRLRAFVIFNIVMLALMFNGSGFLGMWPVSFIWAAILAADYVRHFGWPGNQDDQQDQDPDRPQWKDKDLV